jgi:ssDNA-binding Zn-finger/Zn-ribbon topoisomerase 1
MKYQQELFNNIVSIDKSKDTKICIKCNQEKPVESFAHFKDRGGERVCTKCRNFLSKAAHDLRKIHAHPGKDYKCPICLKLEPLVLDHNHNTGKFKGWLCSRCNSALGFFEDNINYVRRALKYLEDCEQKEINNGT